MVTAYEKAIKSLWIDACTVYTQEKTKDEVTKRTVFTEACVFEDEPCKLSFETITSTDDESHAQTLTQSVKLFLSSDVEIPPGSKIVVTRKGKNYKYKQSGPPGVFTYHQEVPLEFLEEWA